MYIKEFHIQNFKSFEDVKLHLNEGVSILTGVNNSGKTTVLEALSLWHECFSKLIMQAGRGTKNYQKGDYVLGNTQIRYFQFDQINSVRCPNFEDIFHNRDKRKKIFLTATIDNKGETIKIPFIIGSGSGQNYDITLADFSTYNFGKFNDFFRELPLPISLYYASPIAAIQQEEDFTTTPAIQDAIVKRNSASVLRNRLYTLYNNQQDPSLFQTFLDNLSYVLYNSKKKITLNSSSNIQRDKQVVFLAETNGKDIPKDIALLGSGTLQIMEILLNLSHSEPLRKDFKVVLLDEPDSYIHREIQGRLIELLTRFSVSNQIIMTTHNEALIRKAGLSQLFHLEEKPKGEYRSLVNHDLSKQNARFSGIMPPISRPMISALSGDTTGLDFINAVEADIVIFTEGEEDARMIDILLRQQINNRKKYAYWVLGGITEVFERIEHYKTVFSAIKNQKTLWEKSILIIDRDYLNDAHQRNLPAFFEKELDLKSHLWSSYTIESTLMIDLTKCAQLVEKWIKHKDKNIEPNWQNIENQLVISYAHLKSELKTRFDKKETIEKIAYVYQNIRDKVNGLSAKPAYRFITENDVQLASVLLPNYIESCLEKEELYKLMTKYDVEKLINEAIKTYTISFKIDTDFIPLIAQVDKSNWQSEWDFLTTI
jgi:AAA15 family ATPase/GTPase